MRLGRFIPGLVLLAQGSVAQAQLSLSTAVELAERNSPRVQMAQSDVDRASASLSVSRDAFIPTVATTGGYGRSTGAPLGVPVIFSISAQSLIYSFSQQDYIRSAHAGLASARHALAEAKIAVAEDTTNTYLALNNLEERQKALQQAEEIAQHLVSVTQGRLDAGIDPRIELTRAKITATQIHLQSLSLRDEIAGDTQHLADLTGTGARIMVTDPASVPRFGPLPEPGVPAGTSAPNEGVAAAYSLAKARQWTAKGDRRYLYLPQVALQANYSRVDTNLSSYNFYYPSFAVNQRTGLVNSQNALGFGAAITIPLLDFGHRAHAKESAADAAHALADAHLQESNFLEGRARLQNSTQELVAREDLARENQQLAQDQLDTVRVQMQPEAGSLGGPQVTPKDELNAELQERLRYVDVLVAEVQLQQTRINLLRQQGQLNDFIHQGLSGSPAGTPTTPPAQDVVPGVPPGSTPPVVPGSGVTGGSVPNTTTTPVPGAPASAPQTPPHE